MSEQDRQSHSEQSSQTQSVSKRDVHSLLRIVRHLSYEVAQMSMSLDALTAQVATQIEVETSAIVLIQQIADALKNSGGDPVEVEALRVQLETSANSLRDAVDTNTLPIEPDPVDPVDPTDPTFASYPYPEGSEYGWPFGDQPYHPYPRRRFQPQGWRDQFGQNFDQAYPSDKSQDPAMRAKIARRFAEDELDRKGVANRKAAIAYKNRTFRS